MSRNSAVPSWYSRTKSLFLDSPYRLLPDSISNSADVQPSDHCIPKTVIQTTERNLLGRRLRNSMQRFRELNPDYSFCIFDAAKRDRYMSKNWKNTKILDIYNWASIGQLRSDIFRYCILFDKGGFYFDISKGISVPFKEIFNPQAEAVISFESHSNGLAIDSLAKSRIACANNLALQWGFGFKPGHTLLKIMIELIESEAEKYVNSIFPDPKSAILRLSGPYMFTRALHIYASRFEMDGIQQLGVDFEGKGVLALHGSGSRFRFDDDYSRVSNVMILRKTLTG